MDLLTALQPVLCLGNGSTRQNRVSYNRSLMQPQEWSIDRQVSYLLKGCAEVIDEQELRGRLIQSRQKKKPLTVKVGFDPTAPDLHLGHAVLLRKMKHFQDLGHRVIFLIGDFTGKIGDPSGRNVTRPPLTRGQVLENAGTYKKQVFKILDEKVTVIDFNSRWLGRLSSEDWIHLCGRYTVARMLERDDFAKRMATHQPISIHELLYPLAQAYDSVVLQADFELGGTDQKFNLLVGRQIQREYGQSPQVLIMTPVLEGLDGVEKMSKSFGNTIGIDEPAAEIYGKLMSISDELMYRYYELLTDLSNEDLQKLKESVRRGEKHPMQAKSDLAFQIVGDLHSDTEADAAQQHFNRVFRRQEMPEDMPRYQAGSENAALTDLLLEISFAASKSEARRLIRQGGVSIDGNKIDDPAYRLEPVRRSEFVLRVGRRKFARILPK